MILHGAPCRGTMPTFIIKSMSNLVSNHNPDTAKIHGPWICIAEEDRQQNGRWEGYNGKECPDSCKKASDFTYLFHWRLDYRKRSQPLLQFPICKERLWFGLSRHGQDDAE